MRQPVVVGKIELYDDLISNLVRECESKVSKVISSRRKVIKLEIQPFIKLSEVIKCLKEVAPQVKSRMYQTKFINYPIIKFVSNYKCSEHEQNKNYNSLKTKSREETINHMRSIRGVEKTCQINLK